MILACFIIFYMAQTHGGCPGSPHPRKTMASNPATSTEASGGSVLPSSFSDSYLSQLSTSDDHLSEYEDPMPLAQVPTIYEQISPNVAYLSPPAPPTSTMPEYPTCFKAPPCRPPNWTGDPEANPWTMPPTFKEPPMTNLPIGLQQNRPCDLPQQSQVQAKFLPHARGPP